MDVSCRLRRDAGARRRIGASGRFIQYSVRRGSVSAASARWRGLPQKLVLNWPRTPGGEGDLAARAPIRLGNEISRCRAMSGEHDVAVERPRGKTLSLIDDSVARDDARAE